MRKIPATLPLALLILGFLLAGATALSAQVAVFPAAGGGNICPGGSFQVLDDILITETGNTDFEGGANGSGFTYVIKPTSPVFRFEPGFGSATGGNSNLSIDSIRVRQDSVILWYSISGNASGADTCRISGLRVRATGPGSGELLRTGGTAIHAANQPIDSLNHGSLLTASGPVTADLAIDSIMYCPGDSLSLGASLSVSGSASPFSYTWSPASFLDDPSIDNPRSGPVGTINYILTVLDTNGCGASDSILVFQDTVPPLAACQAATVYLGGSGSIVLNPLDVDNGSADNCGLDTLFLSQSLFSCADTGLTSVLLTVQDSSGNQDTCSAFVTVLDTIAGTAICQDTTIALSISGSFTIDTSFVNNGSFDNCGMDSAWISQTAFTCADTGINPITLVVRFADQTIDSCTALVTVADTTPPVPVCGSDTVYLDALGQASAVPAQLEAGSSDNCGITGFALSQSTFACGDTGPNLIQLILTDAAGNSDSCGGIMTVLDTISPVAICKDTTLYLDGSGTVSIPSSTLDNGSTDVCGIGGYVLTDNIFNCNEIGLNPETLAVSDSSGNSDSCAVNITVLDTIFPVFAGCPTNIVLQTDSSLCNPAVNWVAPSASDNCSPLTILSNFSPGDSFPVGLSQVSYLVSDPSGNSDTCSFSVDIQNDPLQVSLFSQVDSCGFNVSCFGDSTGWIGSVIQGGCLPYSLSWNDPAGSTTDSVFNLPAGTYQLSVTDGRGASASASFTLTGPAELLPGAIGINQQICEGTVPGPIVNVTSPSGGPCTRILQWQISTDSVVWSDVPGANTSSLSPSDTLFSDRWYRRRVLAGSCDTVYSPTAKVTVLQRGTATLSGLATDYCVDAQQDTLGGTPVGGSFSGPGISGNVFLPSLAGIGVHTITYTATDSNSCSVDSSLNTTVHALPVVSFSGLNAAWCEDASPGILTGSPTGGTFSGPGITGNSFDPSAAGPGNHTITYSFTDSNGCSASSSQNTTVNALPNVIFFGLQAIYCNNDQPDTLTGFPAGGSFSGSGISGNVFSPSNAGTYLITYQYTDGNGCSNSFSRSVTVNPAPTASFVNLGTFFTPFEAPDTLQGSPSGGSFSGTGVSQGIFYPSIAPIGTSTLVYTYTNASGCTDTDTAIVVVDTNFISGLDDRYCLEDPFSILIGSPPDSLGYFSGPGIQGDTFFPALADTGMHTIFYHFQDSVNGWDSIPQNVIVNPQPVVFFAGLAANYCTNESAVNLTGNQLGGAFSGSGMVGNTFDPALAGPGPTTITYSFTNANGCLSDTSETTQVFSPTPASFSGLSGPYCTNDPPVNLNASPPSGVFTGNGINGSNYLPSLAGAGQDTVIYFFTNNNNCISSDTQVVVVNGTPFVLFTGLNPAYCTADPAVQLSGVPAGGTFTGSGIAGGTSTFDPGTAQTGKQNITYAYTDPGTGCANDTTIQTSVNPNPITSFGGLDTTYCSDAPSDNLFGSPAGGTFSGPGISGNSFTPAFAGPGLHQISYIYSDLNGCSDTTLDNVRVDTVPDVDFYWSSACDQDTIYFFDSSSVSNPDVITSWFWSLGQGNTSMVQNPQIFYPGFGDYGIQLTVTTDKGCNSSLTKVLHLGAIPLVDFDWTQVCEGDSTQFIDATILPQDTISTWRWFFGDGNEDSTGQAVSYQYASPGEYAVELEVVTGEGCRDSIIQTLQILPKISGNAFPYFEDFENGSGGWAGSIEGFSSWEFGVPNGSIINTAYSGDSAWVTGLSGGYDNNEDSWLNSPCFDFTGLEKPMISFHHINNTQPGGDGVVLEASVDGGASWIVVGEENKGINWYNSSPIAGSPGDQNLNPVGWSGTSNGWVNSRYKLDNLIGVDGLRFRWALGSDASINLEGFGLDDVLIGERTKVLLLEEFTNSSNLADASANPSIYNSIAQNSRDMLAVFYHLPSQPGQSPDPMNLDNPIDASGREIFYGFTNPPWTVLDGNFVNGAPINLTQDKIDVRSLQDAKFSIDQLTWSQTGNNLSVDLDFSFISDTNWTGDLLAHLALIEREVTGFTTANGESNFEWVMKKMAPDAGGTQLSQTTWLTGNTGSVNESFNLGPLNIYDAQQLGIVAWLQDKNSKEIFQAAYDGPQVIIGREGGAPVVGGLKVYPNPANAHLMLEWTGKPNRKVELISLLGTVVLTQEMAGNQGKINVDGIPAGVYVLRISGEGNRTEVRKVVIEH